MDAFSGVSFKLSLCTFVSPIKHTLQIQNETITSHSIQKQIDGRNDDYGDVWLLASGDSGLRKKLYCTLTHTRTHPQNYIILCHRAHSTDRTEKRFFRVFCFSVKTARSSGAAITIVRSDMCMNEYHTRSAHNNLVPAYFLKTSSPNQTEHLHEWTYTLLWNKIKQNRYLHCEERVNETIRSPHHNVIHKHSSNNIFKSKYDQPRHILYSHIYMNWIRYIQKSYISWQPCASVCTCGNFDFCYMYGDVWTIIKRSEARKGIEVLEFLLAEFLVARRTS